MSVAVVGEAFGFKPRTYENHYDRYEELTSDQVKIFVDKFSAQIVEAKYEVVRYLDPFGVEVLAIVKEGQSKLSTGTINLAPKDVTLSSISKLIESKAQAIQEDIRTLAEALSSKQPEVMDNLADSLGEGRKAETRKKGKG